MTTESPREPFTRKETVDKPGIIGARWWHENAAAQVPRRQAMTGLFVLGGAIGAMALIGTSLRACRSSSSSSPSFPSFSSDPDYSFQPRAALEMQRQYGWDFGATGEALVFDGTSTLPFDRDALSRMPTELAPRNGLYMPYYVRTLFESPRAMPTSKLTDTDAPVTPLSQALVPISTPAMTAAYEQGAALASLLDDPRAKDLAVIVDLPGPEAVAFAAGAANVLDPVFLFDNWPHPRGVVPAHLTLAAAAYYQPRFAETKASRPSTARPIFVLDRKRLTDYTDDASQFDNRHTARLPAAPNLTSLGVKNVVYVGPNAVDRQELDDIADDFLAYAPRITLRLLPATTFDRDDTAADAGKPDAGKGWHGPYYYRGSSANHRAFWSDWSAGASSLPLNALQTYTPTPRKTPYSTGAAPTSSSVRARPSNFGMIPVAVAVGTGLILGAKISRSGSWNRTSSTSSGS